MNLKTKGIISILCWQFQKLRFFYWFSYFQSLFLVLNKIQYVCDVRQQVLTFQINECGCNCKFPNFQMIL